MSRAPIADYLTDFGDNHTASFFEVAMAEAEKSPPPVLDAADIQAQCEEMYARGIEDGKRLAEEAFDMERAEFDAAIAVAREACADELAALGERIGTDVASSLDELCAQIADTVADLLKPFLLEAVANRSVAALLDALDRLTRDPGCPVVEVQGPQALVDAIAARLHSREVSVQAGPGPETDVRVRVGRSVIDMRLAEWAAALSLEKRAGHE